MDSHCIDLDTSFIRATNTYFALYLGVIIDFAITEVHSINQQLISTETKAIPITAKVIFQ